MDFSCHVHSEYTVAILRNILPCFQARGIDIPMLDNVVNYNFPAKPKLFVHRVGRVARAGRSGSAYSLVSPDEAPYLLDLHLFLGRPLKLAGPSETSRLGKTLLLKINFTHENYAYGHEVVCYFNGGRILLHWGN